MPSPVELSLNSLLPTVSFLPPELVDLATSLLAQSRFKAASLKPEEEIARTYACSHIACQRLQNALALESFRPMPPCKPRVYNKLLEYLQSALGANPATPRSARVVDREAAVTPRSGRRSMVGGVTPSKTKEEVLKAPTQARSSRKRKMGEDEHAQPLDERTMPLIRAVCKSLGEPRAAPHAFVGIDTIYKTSNLAELFKDHRGGKISSRAVPTAKDQPTAFDPQLQRLVTNVCCLVVIRMTAEDGGAYALEQYRKADTAAMKILGQELDLSNNQTSQHSVDEYQAELQAIRERNPATMDWYQSVPTLSVDKLDVIRADDQDDSRTADLTSIKKTPLRRSNKRIKAALGDEEEDTSAAGLLPGLGTMFQPALDWLSRERRMSYLRWESGIIKRIATLSNDASIVHR